MKSNENEILELKEALLKAEKNIERLHKTKSDFISLISHELRTPLTSIKESVSLVLEEVAGPLNENQKKFLTIAKNNIERLVGVVTSVLDFSKLDSGRVNLHRKKIDINALIKEVATEIRDTIEAKAIRLDIELSDGLDLVWLDPDRIKQVLKNLLSNAVKFNRPGGTVKVLSDRDILDGKKFIKVTVEDSGIGISKEDIQRLFKDFNPLDASMTRSYGGLGLGLAIARRIVELHGCDIFVESEKDEGSRFIFRVPVYNRDEEFDILLEEALERARNDNINLTLLFFRYIDQKDREAFSCLDKTIESSLRGPDDKVLTLRDGELIGVIALTGSSGAEKIINRLRNKLHIGLNFGMAVYPDDASYKEALIKSAEDDLNRKTKSL